MKKLLPLLLLLFPLWLLGADVVLSPKKMGPQALPMSSVGKVKMRRWGSVGLSLEGGTTLGEETSISPVLHAFLPWSPFAALILKFETVEYFQTSELIQSRRDAKKKSGWSRGDIYFGSKFHIFTNKKENFRLYLNFLTKTTSGRDQESGRHTNSPRYQIDFSFRKDGILKKLFPRDDYFISPFIPRAVAGYTGLTTWQTDKNKQNDAFCWGLALIYGTEESASLLLEMKGYIGWRNDGDRPLAASVEVIKHFEKWDLHGRYQYAFKDYINHSFAIGLKYKYYVKPYEIDELP